MTGGYLLAGISVSGVSGDKTQDCRGGFDYWVVKVDAYGNELWDKRFGGNQDDILSDIKRTSHGGYLLAGTSYSDSSGDKTQNNLGNTDFWIVKIDSAGNKEWDKRYGGNADAEMLTAVTTTSDGGFLLGGCSPSNISGDKTEGTFGGYDFWIVRIDSAGNKVWDADYGGTGGESVNSMIQTPDRGFLLAETTTSSNSGVMTQINKGGYDYWIVKIDSTGTKEWDKDFGGPADDDVYSVFLTKDHGYLIGGSSQSFIGGDKSEDNIANVQPWIIKTDSLGNKQWDKTIFTDAVSDISNAFQTEEGGYVISSFTAANVDYYKSQPAWNLSPDYWIVKFCDTIVTAINGITPNLQFSVYPNPFVTDLAITMQEDNLKEAGFTITNLLGQTIYYQHETDLSTTYTKMLDLSYLPNGVYFLEVVVDGERMVREVVKQ